MQDITGYTGQLRGLEMTAKRRRNDGETPAKRRRNDAEVTAKPVPYQLETVKKNEMTAKQPRNDGEMTETTAKRR